MVTFPFLLNNQSQKRCMGEWKSSSTILSVCVTCRSMVNFKFQPLYPRGTAPGFHCIEGWMGHRAGLDDTEKRTILSLPGIELSITRSSSTYPNRYTNRVIPAPARALIAIPSCPGTSTYPNGYTNRVIQAPAPNRYTKLSQHQRVP
jgi:hypothetical protein